MSLINIQIKVGTNPDGVFEPMTAKAIINYYGLNPIHGANFLGQCSHETGDWKSFIENLNYSAQGLANTWPHRYAENKISRVKKPNELALKLNRNPELIANNVYANRMGNGSEESGDGWKYRGRGAIQLTGKFNYSEFSKYIKDPEVINNPDKILTDYILDSAMWFFNKNKIWALCTDIKDQTIQQITKKVNGGLNGLNDRIRKVNKYYNWIK